MELNDQVTVKLTEDGAKLLNEYHTTMQQLCSDLNWNKKYKVGDLYKDQLWSLFAVFGEHCCIGGKVIFTNLEPKKNA